MRTSCEPAPARLQRERPKNTTAKTELPKQHQGVDRPVYSEDSDCKSLSTAFSMLGRLLGHPLWWSCPSHGCVLCPRAHSTAAERRGGARRCLQSKGLYCRVLSHAALIQNRQIVREGRLSTGGECAGGVSRGGVCIPTCSPMSKRAALRAVVCIAVTAGCATRLPHAGRAPPPTPHFLTHRVQRFCDRDVRQRRPLSSCPASPCYLIAPPT